MNVLSSLNFEGSQNWTLAAVKGSFSPGASSGILHNAARPTISESLALKRCQPGFSRGTVLQQQGICTHKQKFRLVASSDNHDDDGSSLYHRFVEHAIEQSGQHMNLTPFAMKTKFQELVAKDGKGETRSFAFQSEKVRQFRAAEINGGRSIQVLNMLVFPSAAYDLPIFCAEFVTFAQTSLIVLDLNPLYSPDRDAQYKEKHISPLLPLWKTYNEAWLDMADKAEASHNVEDIYRNQEAQHRYMSWRFTKDPGRNLLIRLHGETHCEEYMKEFLLAGSENMGTKSFLDYFPQFRDQDGSIKKNRSIAGKAFPTRPWDENGNLISPICS